MFLLDNNLSPKLRRHLLPVFPGTVHVEQVGLENSPDPDVWKYAQVQGLAILTKDSDFSQLVQFYGHPPKVVWLRCGNVTTAQALALIQTNELDIRLFLQDAKAGFLEIY